MQTGLGRTGKMLATEHEGVREREEGRWFVYVCVRELVYECVCKRVCVSV